VGALCAALVERSDQSAGERAAAVVARYQHLGAAGLPSERSPLRTAGSVVMAASMTSGKSQVVHRWRPESTSMGTH
jgi:hypothetical protein